jgi:Domain of unknown function (DUF1707)
VAGPGDEIAAGVEGQDCLRSSHADGEQVIAALKDAFVQGRLAKDEFDLRVSKALATYAELDALTADIPAGPTKALPEGPYRESHNKKMIQRGTAAGAGVSVAFTATEVLVGGGSPTVGFVVVPLIGIFMAVLLAGLLTLLSWVLEKGSARQAASGPPTGINDQATGRPAPPDSADRSRQIRHPGHTAEARQPHLLRPRLS